MSPKAGWYRDPVAERWWDGTELTDLTRSSGENQPDGPIAADNPTQPAGWIPDPDAERFWDGDQWTTETRRREHSLAEGKTSSEETEPSPGLPEPLSTAAGATPDVPIDARHPRSSNRFKVVAITAGVIALVAVTVSVLLGRSTGKDDTPVLDVPVGALPLSKSGGVLQPQPGTPIALSAATCGGLLAKIDANDCLEATFGGETHALTFVDDGVEVTVNIFRISTGDSTVEARQVLSGIVGPSDQLDSELAVHAYILRLSTGDAFALLIEEATSDSVYGTVEFVGMSPGGGASTLGVYSGTGIDLAADFDRIFVATKRDDPNGENSLLSTIFPAKDGWVAVDEVVTSNNLDELLKQREVTLFRTSSDGLEPPNPLTASPATTNPPTTLPPVTTNPPTGLIPGSSISCDGSWIAIVSSQTFERTQSVLNKFPGGYAVKNEDACASLNPTFSRGNDAGLPIYIVFFGPFFDRYEAQNQCVSLGRTTMSQCYVAPLTNDPADRSLRFGPTD